MIITIRPLTHDKYIANNLDGELLFTGNSAQEVEDWAADHEYDIEELKPVIRKAGKKQKEDTEQVVYLSSGDWSIKRLLEIIEQRGHKTIPQTLKEAIEFIKEMQSFMNMVPNKKYGNNYEILHRVGTWMRNNNLNS